MWGETTGWSFYGKEGFSKGKQESEGKRYQNSHIDTEVLRLKSGGDVNLIGATAKAKSIHADIKGDLKIESLQDEHKQNSHQFGLGSQFEFGFTNGWDFNINASAEGGSGNVNQVVEQSGLFAEEGGYHITADNVHLKGGAIASTNPANSELTTNKLTFEDIQNSSSYSAISGSISGGYGKGADHHVDNETGKVVSERYAQNNPDSTTKVEPKASPSIGGGLPMYEQGQDSTVTKATLTEGKITLNKDSQPTETTATALGINTDISQANKQVKAPKDVNQLLKEQKVIRENVGHIASAVDVLTQKLHQDAKENEEKAKKELDIARVSGDKNRIKTAQKAYQEAVKASEHWEVGGKYKQAADAITATLTLALAGKPTEAILAGGVSPYINQAIKEITKDTPELNVPAHILWGAVESHLKGGSAVSGAIAVGVGERTDFFMFVRFLVAGN